MNKRVLLAVPLILIGGAIVFLMTSRGGETDNTLFASGTIEATDADLGFQLPGRVATIAPREGEHVEAGVELARLDTRELEARLDAARAQLVAAQARLNELRRGARPQELAAAEAGARAAKERTDDARRDAERAATLFAGGAISRRDLDKANTALQLAIENAERTVQNLELLREGPRVETIQAQAALVDQARAQLSLAEATIWNAVIVAPFAGIVTVRHREPGEAVSPGAPVVTLLDPDDRWIRIYVPEDQIGRVQLGVAATIASDSYPDRTYDGVVVFIGSEAEFTPRNVQTPEERIKLVYPVKVRITGDPNFELKPGVPADVILAAGNR